LTLTITDADCSCPACRATRPRTVPRRLGDLAPDQDFITRASRRVGLVLGKACVGHYSPLDRCVLLDGPNGSAVEARLRRDLVVDVPCGREWLPQREERR
jgi:hypothetical protein